MPRIYAYTLNIFGKSVSRYFGCLPTTPLYTHCIWSRLFEKVIPNAAVIAFLYEEPAMLKCLKFRAPAGILGPNVVISSFKNKFHSAKKVFRLKGFFEINQCQMFIATFLYQSFGGGFGNISVNNTSLLA